MKVENDSLLYDKDKIFIFPIKNINKSVKIIFKKLLCPIYPEYRCKHSKFINTEELNFKLQCDIKDCDRVYSK